MRFRGAIWACAVAALLVWAGAAAAQGDDALARDGLFIRDHNISVSERAHPDYAPLPLRVGAFDLLPVLGIKAEQDDNIYATDAARTSDLTLKLAPALLAQSTWSRHALKLDAGLTAVTYARHSGEDTTDWRLDGVGRLDLARGFGLAGGVGVERDTEPRTASASPVAAVHPVRFDRQQGFGEAAWASGRLRLSSRIALDRFAYDDGRTATGAPVVQSDRDHSEWRQDARAELALSPGASVFLDAALNQRRYTHDLPVEPRRDSDGYRLAAGTNLDLTHLVRGEVELGYLDQSYRSPVYGGVTGAAFAARMSWFPTGLTTISFAAARRPEDAGIPHAGGYAATSASAGIDHELLRNLVLHAGLDAERDVYRNFDRRDRRWGQVLSARYLANRAVTVRAGYVHEAQQSLGAGRGVSWTVHRVFVALALAV